MCQKCYFVHYILINIIHAMHTLFYTRLLLILFHDISESLMIWLISLQITNEHKIIFQILIDLEMVENIYNDVF